MALDRRRDVDRQHLPHVVAGVRRLQRDERGEQHAGAGEQHERERDLGDREDAQAAVGARRDPDAAARQPEPGRRVRRRQPRDVREHHGRDHRQAGADPQQARVHRDVERAHGEARGIAADHGDERAREQHAEHGAGAAEHQALGRAASAAARRVLAPSAARTASSPSRRTERARIRLATFEQAMTNTTPAAASSTSRIVRAGAAI